MGYQHKTVLLNEAVDALNIKPDGVYVDATLGGGGHSRAILDKLGPDGRLIIFDQDEDAWPNAPEDDRVTLVKENFAHLAQFLRYYKIPKVDGILADLGVSSHHFDVDERGFSYRTAGPMDMRMDKRKELTAQKILDEYAESALVRLFSDYGEVPNSKRLASAIANESTGVYWTDTLDFLQFLKPYVMGKPMKYYSQVFQALRMEVNDEMGSLRDLIEQSAEYLQKDGRLVVISFHSIEDGMVKRLTKDQILSEDPLTGQKEVLRNFKPVTKKAIVPGKDEVRENKRARSARMRVYKKT